MFRRLLAGLLGLAAPLALALEGIVLLPDGQPAVDAQVSILGQAGSTRTGPDGRFRWVPEPRPPFQVLVALPGGLYAPPVLVESVPSSGAPLEVRLRLAVAESVTVKAGATPHTEAPPANAPALLLPEELRQRRPGTLTAAIETLPGVGRLEEGHAAVPSIRGLARGRTLLLVDGARVSAERRAGPSATFLDPVFLDAIEVSRGPGALAYGSDAFGGVIHARTRQVVPGSPWEGRLEGTLGTGVPERSLAAQISKGLSEGGFIVQARHRDFRDYQGPGGRVGNSSLRDGGLRARLEREWGPGRASLAVQTDLGRDIGKPSLDSEATRAFYPREDSHRLVLAYDGDPRGALTRWSAHAFLGHYRLVTERDRRPTSETPRQVGRSDVRSRDYGLRLAGAGALGGWRLQGGIDLNGRSGLMALGVVEEYGTDGTRAGLTEESSIEDAARHDAALYVSIDGRLLARLTASAGLRQDHVTSRNAGGHFGDREAVHDPTSAMAALTAGPFAGVTLTGQVSHGFRDPTLSDRYFRGVSGRGFVTGNPDLSPERSLQYDLALRRGGRVRAALYLYRYELRQLVERYREGADFFFRNRGRARLQGVELEARTDLGGALSVELGAQAARGRALDDGAPLADIPAERLTLAVCKGFGERGSASLRAVLQRLREDPGPTEKPTPGFGTLEAAGTWRIRRGLEARLALRNLLDHAYPQSPDELAVVAPGRSAALTLSATF